MFDSGGDLSRLDGSALATLIAENHAELMERETRVLQLACAWADSHDLDPNGGDYQPLVERACAWGGEGTPEVSEYCAAELGALQGTGMVAAKLLIADALDLRHRLPRLWERVRSGQVRAWKARKVAESTRQLSWAAAADVDDAISGFVEMLPWPRFQRILAAAILEADPEAAREREERARTTRDVYAFDSEDGLRTVVARAASGDVAWFLATVNRIAEILAAEGDPDPVGARRSKAMGILASPARALQLLINHRSDRSDAAPAGPTPAEPGDRASADAEDQPADDLDHEEPGPDPSEPNEDTSVSLSTSWPDARDFRAARPRVVLHFHLSEEAIRSGHGVVRPEHGEVITLNQLREFLRDAGCRVTVQPVIDPARTAPIDGYEVSPRLRAAVRYREPAEVFPYGTCLTRNMDLDHTKPYVPRCRGGPPGQTSLANLGPLSRSPHRVVTHGGWGKRQPDPGRYLFRSPSGRIFLVTNQGTQDLGSTPFAATVWRAAAPAARTPPQRS